MNQQTKQLIGHIKKDPWIAIEWKACQTEPVAEAYIELIDEAIFERDRKKALQLAFIFRGQSRKINKRMRCMAEACLGSAFCISGLFDLATEQMQEAEELAGSRDDCLGIVNRRWGAILFDNYRYEEALDHFDRALLNFERIDDDHGKEVCLALIARSGVCRLLNRNTEGIGNIQQALPYMNAETPARHVVAAAVNAISLAASSDDAESYASALSVAEGLRDKIKGGRIHSSARGIVRWIRGLAFEKLSDMKNAIRCTESGISTFDRLAMREEKKVAMADLARMRRKGKQRETNDRHIRRLIEASLRLDIDEETEKILLRAKRNPSEENIVAWRNSLSSYVPSLEPEPEKKVLV